MNKLEAIKHFSQANHEPNWLLEKRLVAYQIASKLPAFHLKGANSKKMAFQDPILGLAQPDCKNYAQPEDQKNGVLVLNLLHAAGVANQMLQENFTEKCFVWRHDQFSAQHVAFLQTGAFVYIPSGVKVEKPINVSPIFDQKKQEKHLLILAGANSQATVVYASGPHTNQDTRMETEILLGMNAQINYYDSATTDAKRNHKGLYAYQAQDSVLNSYVALLNQNDTDYLGEINLDGEGSTAHLNLVSFSHGQQTQDIVNNITNYQDHTKGYIRQRGIVKDIARTHCCTTGKIVPHANRTVSEQAARLLTMDKDSKGEVDPVLLIRNNDVEAAHSASIGQVSPLDLYYLETRGINRKQANYLLALGYLMPLINKFPDHDLKMRITKDVKERLKNER